MSKSIIKLYEDAGFEGREFALTISANNLRDFSFNNKISSVKVVKGTWVLYKHTNFRGKSLKLGPGSYDYSTISEGIGNDVVSSVQLANQINLYEHKRFSGRTLTLDDSAHNFIDRNFNDKASSIEVLGGTWILYEDVGYNGRFALIGEGKYDLQAVRDIIGNDTISSVKLYRD